MEPTTYWVTVATVLPVLSLALVLITRATFLTTLAEGVSIWRIRLSITIMGATVATSAFVVPKAFNSIRDPGQETAEFWYKAADLAITLHCIWIFGTPLFAIAMMLFSATQSRDGRADRREMRREIRVLKRQGSRYRRDLRKLAVNGTKMLLSASAMLWERPWRSIDDALETAKARRIIVSDARYFEHQYAEMTESIEDTWTRINGLKARLAEEEAERRRHWIEELRPMFDASLGRDHRPAPED